MSALLDYAIQMGWLQWLALIFNLLYVIFAARENIWCWVFGFIGVSLLFFVYLDARLYSDVSLQVFYMFISVYGWIKWRSGKKDSEVQIHTIPWASHLKYIGLGVAGTILLGFFWRQFSAALPFIDAFTTSFSVLNTYLVARKVIENWLYWIVIDSVCVVVYIVRDIPLIAILFFIYVLLSVYGYFSWRKKGYLSADEQVKFSA